MGFKDLKKRLTASVEELDQLRLQERFTGLDLTPIGEASCRVPVRIGGEVKRLRTVPRHGTPSLEVVISDGTGEAVAVFTGRRSLGGMDHGRGIVIEGVAHPERGKTVLLNPAYTLLPQSG